MPRRDPAPLTEDMLAAMRKRSCGYRRGRLRRAKAA